MSFHRALRVIEGAGKRLPSKRKERMPVEPPVFATTLPSISTLYPPPSIFITPPSSFFLIPISSPFLTPSSFLPPSLMPLHSVPQLPRFLSPSSLVSLFSTFLHPDLAPPLSSMRPGEESWERWELQGRPTNDWVSSHGRKEYERNHEKKYFSQSSHHSTVQRENQAAFPSLLGHRKAVDQIFNYFKVASTFNLKSRCFKIKILEVSDIPVL
ncbi:uncharacterized protein LOC143032170 [Oratosquilla oratoria]|uniref:uncharacterized protein LOC143032170 n=1 Tax=Oratosquilla oratoria TaxID=337810 RepID=UPI003F7712C0